MWQKLKFYFRESYQEFKRVNWPSRQKTLRLTMVVIGLSIAVAVFLGILDLIFTYLLEKFLL